MLGGLRKNIRSYDFKYTLDPTRKNWSKSVIPHVESLVNIVANIPYSQYNYGGNIIYTTRGTLQEEEEDSGFNQNNLDIDNENGEILFNDSVISPKNSLNYNFFGGMCFELLNDVYPNVNLYDFVDPTSDIDIQISFKMNKEQQTNIGTKNYQLIKDNKRYSDIFTNLYLVVNPTITEPDIPPYLNPYFEDVSNFIFNHMLVNLNKLSLSVENSVPFNIDEYDIDDKVKKEELGYRVIDIENSNAKLIRYLDRDEKTLRIQIVLKIMVGSESIIDHLLEFLITNRYEEETYSLKLYGDNRPAVNISSMYTLFFDNLDAYNKRKILLKEFGARSHKPINHFTRFIYLLDLIKKNPQVYSKFSIAESNLILQKLHKQYIYYVIKDNQFIQTEIPTIDVICAFYKIFTTVFNPIKIRRFNVPEITQEEEEQCYNKLMTLFKINASPFRKFLSAKAEGVKKNKKTNKRHKRTQKNKNYKKRSQKNKRTL